MLHVRVFLCGWTGWAGLSCAQMKLPRWLLMGAAHVIGALAWLLDRLCIVPVRGVRVRVRACVRACVCACVRVDDWWVSGWMSGWMSGWEAGRLEEGGWLGCWVGCVDLWVGPGCWLRSWLGGDGSVGRSALITRWMA